MNALLRESITLQDFSKEFLEWVEKTNNLEPATKRCYKNGWRLLSATALAGKKMDEITNHDAETTGFPGGASNANQALRTLRRMFSKAQELKRMFTDVKIELRKEWGRSISMTGEQAAQIAGYMEGDPRDAFLVIRSTGARPGEVFALRWEYAYLGKLYYQNPKGKTPNARRVLPLLDQSIDVLRRRHLEQGMPTEGWVFPSKQSPTGHMMTITKAFNRARDKAGLSKAMVLYTGRHGAGTDLAEVASLKTVMQVLGHGDTKTAMRYQHPDVNDLQARLNGARTTGRIQ